MDAQETNNGVPGVFELRFVCYFCGQEWSRTGLTEEVVTPEFTVGWAKVEVEVWGHA